MLLQLLLLAWQVLARFAVIVYFRIGKPILVGDFLHSTFLANTLPKNTARYTLSHSSAALRLCVDAVPLQLPLLLPALRVLAPFASLR
jgi:hypothetical protein